MAQEQNAPARSAFVLRDEMPRSFHFRRLVASLKKAGLGQIVDFVPNETICTEACHKFRPEQICEIARTAGYRLEAQWIDAEWPFAENLLVVT